MLLGPEDAARLAELLSSEWESPESCPQHHVSQAWRGMPVIQALGRQIQEDQKFKIILG